MRRVINVTPLRSRLARLRDAALPLALYLLLCLGAAALAALLVRLWTP